jgi:hypothetical protein
LDQLFPKGYRHACGELKKNDREEKILKKTIRMEA